jgi:SAM-dependent methyltransferase
VDPRHEANRANWNDRVPVHLASRHYDVAGFRAGRQSLHSIELEEVGGVRGRSLLHLQCHLGLDTLSWARLGAKVTGVDFSEPAIAAATQLAADLKLPAAFVCGDVQALDLGREFDIVFVSYGVLWWLSDLRAWAQVIARHLKPGGFFYLVEDHPVAHTFVEDEGTTELRPDPRYRYFDRQALRSEEDGTYADRQAHLPHRVNYGWMHPLSEVVEVLIGAGLRIDFLHEFPLGVRKRFPFMAQDGRWWRIPGDPIPLTFSLRASRDASSSHPQAAR